MQEIGIAILIWALGMAWLYFLIRIFPRIVMWIGGKAEPFLIGKRGQVTAGYTLLLAALMLCGMILRYAGTPCETTWFQDILLLVGSYYTGAKGCRLLYEGHDLGKDT